jgi:probable HAF family extracellular repeat protein
MARWLQMSHRFAIPGAALALPMLLATPRQAVADDYFATELGTLGGDETVAQGINESGQIVGFSRVTVGNDILVHPFLYSHGVMTDLGTPDTPGQGRALAINAGSEVVGVANHPVPGSIFQKIRATSWSGGGLSALSGLGDIESGATAISENGEIVGAFFSDFRFHAYRRLRSGVVVDLGTLGDDSFAHGINTLNHVVGTSVTGEAGRNVHHAFLHRDGRMLDLSSNRPGLASAAVAINQAGAVVGWAEMLDLTRRAVVFDPATLAMTELGTLGGANSTALAVNAIGHVVGKADAVFGSERGFLYRDGAMLDINTLVSSDFTIMEAVGINAAGQIAVNAKLSGDDRYRALLLTPFLLNRFAYAWAERPTAARYRPAGSYSYNSSGGGIEITRASLGTYVVTFDGLAAWGPQLSSAAAVTTYGSSTISCSVVNVASGPVSVSVTVACWDVASNLPADSLFNIMVLGNDALASSSAFVVAGGAPPLAARPSPLTSWTTGAEPILATHNGPPGNYSVLLGTGSIPRSAKIVTGQQAAGTRCRNVRASFSEVEVQCHDHRGTPADRRFSILQVAGGRRGRRLGFAVADQEDAASYTPDSSTSFSSSGGAITATRSSAGRYRIDFVGQQKEPGHTETVHVTPVGTTPASCNVVAWANFEGLPVRGLSVFVECRDLASQFVDTHYQVLIIE